MEDLYEEMSESLRDWFKKSKSKGGKPGWVQVVSGKPCARQPGQKTTPKCVSSAKRASMSKKERESAQRRKRAADPGQPKKSGAAKPTYVSTDKKKKKKSKKNEDLYMSLDKIIAEELEAVLDEKKKRKKKKKKKSGKKDACYHKVKSRYKVWPSAYASGALVKCRKVGAKNWGKSKKENLQIMVEDELSQVLFESHTKEQEEELKTIVGELENASKMHAGQAERIQQILDETDDDKLEEGDKKNCGCGQDPCKTYGTQVKIKEEDKQELEEDCQDGYERVPGSKEFAPGSCREKTDEGLDLEAIIEEELEAVLAEKKKKKPCKPSKGKRFAKRVNGKCRSFGQKGQAKGGGDRIRPGTAKGDAYCARSAKIKKCKNPPCANALSRKKWKCRGSKSMKE